MIVKQCNIFVIIAQSSQERNKLKTERSRIRLDSAWDAFSLDLSVDKILSSILHDQGYKMPILGRFADDWKNFLP